MSTKIPFGYVIQNGQAYIDDHKADQLKLYYQLFLSGESMAEAARQAHLPVCSSTFPNLFKRKEYCGTDYYPAIITPEYQQELITEWERRKGQSPRKAPTHPVKGVKVYTRFRLIGAPVDNTRQGADDNARQLAKDNTRQLAKDTKEQTDPEIVGDPADYVATMYQRIRPRYV